MPVRACAFALVALASACAGVQQRFPDDVQSAFAHDKMRRAETDHFIIYYPAQRDDELARFVHHAERCVDALRDAAVIKSGPWRDKMVVVMPEVAFDNAFVVPDLEGYEAVALIPTMNTLDFATEFGLPPDPGYIACHELTHYTHDKQIAGVWRFLNFLFGDIYSPQLGFDPWFFEGLATHYETALNPNVGRPTWPIFTGMYAAAYAEHRMNGGDMSQFGRLSSVGHHYLVGTMFMRFMTETYGEAALWKTVESQAHALTGLLFPTSFQSGVGVSFSTLMDQFDAWTHKTFPVRARAPGQREIAVAGNDARYARGRDGTEAWVGEETDLPPRLHVRDGSGNELANIALVGILPGRTLMQAAPLLVSGLSITADGGEVWMTVIDYAATVQVPRLVRWRRGESSVTEIRHDLGPGATISPRGDVYYYCAVDGDRWSLGAYDVRTASRRVVRNMAAGSYVLGARVSADGTRLVTDTFDGTFHAEVVDAASGAVLRDIRGNGGGPVYDASFLGDGRVMWLGEVAQRFQVMVEGVQATDAPYAALGAREANGSIRFLDREGWEWEVAEVGLPAGGDGNGVGVGVGIGLGSGSGLGPEAKTITAVETAFCPWEHFFYPQQRAPTLLFVSSGAPHIGAVLGGGDRLAQHRWSLAGYAQPPSSGSTAWHYAGDAEYLNEMLSPYIIYADADFYDWADPVVTPQGKTAPPDLRRERDVTLSIARTWRQAFTASLAGLYTDDFDQLVIPERRHLGGPQLSLAYDGEEDARYVVPRRALYATFAAAFYPHALSTFAGEITDVGGSLGAVVPLPWGRRHTFGVTVRGRALVGEVDTGLLQLGGDTGLTTLLSYGNETTAPPIFNDSRFPPNLHFVEPLRGYEDYGITTDRAEIVDLDYRYPIIIDRGTAATLRYLPALWLAEIDVDVFGDGALDKAGDEHGAVGASFTLQLAVQRLPFLVTYQIARRVFDDEAIVQLLGVGLGPGS
jgi:hypothetical protein